MGDWKSDKIHTRQFSIKLNLRTDKDIIEILEKCPNRQGYIKELIRRDNKCISKTCKQAK